MREPSVKYPRGSYRVKAWVLSSPANFPYWREEDVVIDMAASPREALFLFRRLMLGRPEGAMMVQPFSVLRTGPGPNHPEGVEP